MKFFRNVITFLMLISAPSFAASTTISTKQTPGYTRADLAGISAAVAALPSYQHMYVSEPGYQGIYDVQTVSAGTCPSGGYIDPANKFICFSDATTASTTAWVNGTNSLNNGSSAVITYTTGTTSLYTGNWSAYHAAGISISTLYYSSAAVPGSGGMWAPVVSCTPDTMHALCVRDAGGTGVYWQRVDVNNLDWSVFGAVGDGTTDDTAAIAAAFAANATYGIYVTGHGTTYKMTSGITVDQAKAPASCGGGILNFSSVADGNWTALTLVNTASTPVGQLTASQHHTKYLSNCALIGPGAAGAGAAYSYTSKGVLWNGAGLSAEDISVFGFGYGHYMGTSGVYLNRCKNCASTQNKYGIYGPSGGSDYGENIVFDGGKLDGNYINASWHMPTGRLTLSNMSDDYPGLRSLEVDNSGEILSLAGWAESDQAGAGNAQFVNSGGLLQFSETHIQQRGTSGSLVQCGLSNTSAGATTIYRDVFLFNVRNTTDYLDCGAGNVQLTMSASYGVPYIPTKVSASSEKLSDPLFASSTIPDLWFVDSDSAAITARLTGTNITLSQDTTTAHAGTASLKWVKNVGGANGSPGLVVGIVPGRNTNLRCWYSLDAGSNGQNAFVYFFAAHVDGTTSYGSPIVRNGTALGSPIPIAGTTSAIPWTTMPWEGGLYKIPNWANVVGLSINATNFSGTIHFSDCTVQQY